MQSFCLNVLHDLMFLAFSILGNWPHVVEFYYQKSNEKCDEIDAILNFLNGRRQPLNDYF